MDIRGHIGPPRVDRGGLRHRARVLRLGHLRPRREEAPRHALGRWAAWTSRRSPRAARGARPPPRRPADRLPAAPRALAGLPRRHRRRARCGASSTSSGGSTHGFIALDAMLMEINPLILTADGRVVALDAKVTIDSNALYRHPELAALQESGDRGPAGAHGPGAGRDLRQARRRRRHPGQRRRPGHEHARRGRPRRRAPGQLPRRRRRLEGRRGRHGARGAAVRPQGQGAAGQHLRRHHPLRRGRRGPADRPRPPRHHAADRRAPGRHQRGGGPARSSPSARPPTSSWRPTMLSAARRAVELAKEAA